MNEVFDLKNYFRKYVDIMPLSLIYIIFFMNISVLFLAIANLYTGNGTTEDIIQIPLMGFLVIFNAKAAIKKYAVR